MSKISNTPLIKKLLKVGFSQKEAQVYLALLTGGVSTVQTIQKVTRIKRSSIYVVLDKLIQKGLVNLASTFGIKKFAAAPPERLAFIAQETLEKQTLAHQNLKTLFPELQSLHHSARHRPNIQIFEGKEDFIKSFEDSLSAKENPIRISSSADDIFRSLPDYLPSYIQKRFALGIKMKGIHPYDTHARIMIERQPKNFDEQVFVRDRSFTFPSDMAIYDNKVGFTSHKNLVIVLVESKEIADVMKILFDLAFKGAERLSIAKT